MTIDYENARSIYTPVMAANRMVGLMAIIQRAITITGRSLYRYGKLPLLRRRCVNHVWRSTIAATAQLRQHYNDAEDRHAAVMTGDNGIITNNILK